MVPLMTKKPPFLSDRSLRTGAFVSLHSAAAKGHNWPMAEAAQQRTTGRAGPLKLDDFEPAARAILPQGIYDYIAGGAEDEATLRGNREAFARYRFRFKVLTSADRADLSHEVLGQRFAMPVHLAPAAIQRMAHPDGEVAAYRAATDAGIAYCLSTLSSVYIEDVAASAAGARRLVPALHARRAGGQHRLGRARRRRRLLRHPADRGPAQDRSAGARHPQRIQSARGSLVCQPRRHPDPGDRRRSGPVCPGCECPGASGPELGGSPVAGEQELAPGDRQGRRPRRRCPPRG